METILTNKQNTELRKTLLSKSVFVNDKLRKLKELLDMEYK